MKLIGPGKFFELQILGYEFPHITDALYDSDWLIIKGDVKYPSIGSWSFCEPCLLTFEVVKLISFLEACMRNEITHTLCGFFESNMRFLLINRNLWVTSETAPSTTPALLKSELNYNTLRVCFDVESLPPWIPREYTDEHDLYCDFPLNLAVLADVIQSLRDQLAKFPQRVYFDMPSNSN